MNGIKRFAIALWLGAASLAVSLTPVLAGCLYVEGGVGGSMSKDKLSFGGPSIDLSQSGVLASLGLFCRVMGPVKGSTGMFIDLGGRGNWMHSTGDLVGVKLESTYAAEALARLGYRYHEKIEVYAQGGAAWSDLKLSAGLPDKQPFNWEMGAGIRTHVAGGTWLGLEGGYTIADKQDILGASLKSDTLAVRATLTWYFGETALTAAPLK